MKDNEKIFILKSNFKPKYNPIIKNKWDEIKKSMKKDERIKEFDKK